jgi:hypothetical protein
MTKKKKEPIVEEQESNTSTTTTVPSINIPTKILQFYLFINIANIYLDDDTVDINAYLNNLDTLVTKQFNELKPIALKRFNVDIQFVFSIQPMNDDFTHLVFDDVRFDIKRIMDSGDFYFKNNSDSDNLLQLIENKIKE